MTINHENKIQALAKFLGILPDYIQPAHNHAQPNQYISQGRNSYLVMHADEWTNIPGVCCIPLSDDFVAIPYDLEKPPAVRRWRVSFSIERTVVQDLYMDVDAPSEHCAEEIARELYNKELKPVMPLSQMYWQDDTNINITEVEELND